MSRLTGRKHDRSRAVATVMVLWEDAGGHDKFSHARSFDISETGLCVELPEAVPLRSYVTLRADHFGIVIFERQCIAASQSRRWWNSGGDTTLGVRGDVALAVTRAREFRCEILPKILPH